MSNSLVDFPDSLTIHLFTNPTTSDKTKVALVYNARTEISLGDGDATSTHSASLLYIIDNQYQVS